MIYENNQQDATV